MSIYCEYSNLGTLSTKLYQNVFLFRLVFVFPFRFVGVFFFFTCIDFVDKFFC